MMKSYKQTKLEETKRTLVIQTQMKNLAKIVKTMYDNDTTVASPTQKQGKRKAFSVMSNDFINNI